MSVKEFTMKEINEAKEKYAAEVRERWGDTDAYRESQRRTAAYGEEDWKAIQEEMDAVFGGLHALMAAGTSADSPEARELVGRWQAHITKNFYPCPKEMLEGLGQMYVDDPRFTKNLDERYGEGTAQYAADAFRGFCRE